eukprot:TRINITY_DN10755_c0_g1_i1.p1 TRINITY_DN10755_c0_g1~~TRINITY_DN10755_c0_g1_i1.p1  ORF type:complete len:308 (+),score=38.34 TRINITY_DN10755_c0_g1_i1:30-953(+)
MRVDLAVRLTVIGLSICILIGRSLMCVGTWFWLAKDATTWAVAFAAAGGALCASALFPLCVCSRLGSDIRIRRVLPLVFMFFMFVGVFVVAGIRVATQAVPALWEVYTFLMFGLALLIICSFLIILFVFKGIKVGRRLFDLEVVIETLRDVNPDREAKLTKLANIISMVSVIIEFVQLSNLAFVDGLIPVGYSTAKQVSSWAILDFQVGFAVQFWCFVCAPTVLILAFFVSASLVKRVLSKDIAVGRKRAARIILYFRTAVGIISLIVFTQLLKALTCSPPPPGGVGSSSGGVAGVWRLKADPTIMC